MSHTEHSPIEKSKFRSSSTSRALGRNNSVNFKGIHQTTFERTIAAVVKPQDRIIELEAVIRLKDYEIERLEYMNNYLETGLKKREELIKTYFEDNCKLKDEIKMMKTIIERLRQDLKSKRRLATSPAAEDAHKLVNDVRIKNIEELVEDEDLMVERLNDMQKRDLVDFVETIKSLVSDFKSLFKVTMSIKQLVKASYTISMSLVLNDALEKIISEICEILHCDRATVFILDEINSELWSRVAKGSSSTIRIPMDKGVVGYVATTGKAVRIDEAYLDYRFNKEVDQQTHYRTKTILCVPIKEFTGNIIGVCQGINKLEGLFTSDDEALMHLLANQAGAILKNSMQYDKTLVSHHRLLRLIKIGNRMYETNDLAQMIQRATAGLKEIMSADKAVVLLYDEPKNKMYRVLENNELQYFDLNCGIVGKVISSGEPLDVSNPNNDYSYNPMTDLETSLPILCMPIRSPVTNKIVGALQSLNIKGVGSPTRGRVDLFEVEIIRLFCEQVAICAEKFTRLSSKNTASTMDLDRQPTIVQEMLKNTKSNKFIKKSDLKEIWGGSIAKGGKKESKTDLSQNTDSLQEKDEESDQA